jgi:Na+-translocating ferredoxin:NAD+ oxidoreductase RnfG subunit
MRLLNILFVAGLIAAILGAHPALAQVAKGNEVVSMKDALKEMLQNHGAATLKKVSVTVDAEKSKALAQTYGIETAGAYTVYQGIGADKSSVTGTVVIVNEEGKEGPLQVLIALNPDGQIYDLGFTVFGEDKGRSASTWGFLKQFIDKKAGDPFVLGKDIDGVSGATWSSTSVTSAVERGAVIFAEFLK